MKNSIKQENCRNEQNWTSKKRRNLCGATFGAELYVGLKLGRFEK
jgi:hypothetical protein